MMCAYIYIYNTTWLCAVRSRPPPPPMVSPPKYKGLKPRLEAWRTPTTGVPHPVSYVAWPHTKEWNGGLAEEHVRRDTQTRGVCGVCVCVWCVCVYGKRENHPVPQGEGGGGFSFLPGPHAQLENHKTAGVGGGDAAGSRAQNRGGGGRGCRRSRGISCSTGGGRGEYTMTSITY